MKIYADYAATTPVDSKVLEAMRPYFTERFGNASSLHFWGEEAKKALDESRAIIARALGVKPEEIIFTSGGTESNNLALKGVAFANRKKGKHIVTTAIEHHCVIHACKRLEKQGFSVTYLPVDKEGVVNPKDVEKAIQKDTILVSVMYANNEVGTIQPIKEIAEICKRHNVLFHTDAVQAFGKIHLDMKNIDLLSISSHKIYGPKGVGALYIRKGTEIEPILDGGGHEFGLRSGTENVAGIVGFAKATELIFKNLDKEAKRQIKLRDRLIERVLKIPNTTLNGHRTKRLPNNANFRFKFIEGESLILRLSEKGIAASTSSACSSKTLEPSHVLLAMGVPKADAHGSLRITIGKNTTEKDIVYIVKTLKKIVEELRRISPYKGENCGDKSDFDMIEEWVRD